MFIAFWQSPFQRWSKKTGRRRYHALKGGRWINRSGERLESRQFLTAGPFGIGPPPPAAWHASFEPAALTETNPVNRSALGFGGSVDHFSPSRLLGTAELFRAQPMNELRSLAEFEPLAAPRFEQTDVQPIDTVVVPPPVIRFVVTERPLFEPIDSTYLSSAMEIGGGESVSESLKAPPPASPRPSLVSLTTIAPAPLDAHQAGLANDREVIFVFEGWQTTDMGQVYSEDFSVDPRIRIADVPHQLLADPRPTLSALDGARPTANGGFSVDPATTVERQGSAGSAIVLGQNAETEPSLAGGGRSLVGTLPDSFDGGEMSPAVGSSVNRGTVGYLVAFDELVLSSGADSSGASVNAPPETNPGFVASLVQELLTPHFTCDAASLSVAIQDLAAQVDELGMGLLGVLVDPVTTGETALIAGVVGGGLAYRHWRGGRRNERTEEEELLSSRFIRGHASLRLSGGRTA